MSKNILIVEDEVVTSFEIETHLKNWGYTVIGTPKSGYEALDIIKRDKIDLIIMDIRLNGEMDGIEVVKKIIGLDMPVIYITASSEDSTIQKALKTNPFGYLIKPYDKRELKFVVEMALYKGEMEKKLKKSELLYRTLSEASPDIIIVSDQDGRGIYANESALNMMNLKIEEFIGKGPDEIFSAQLSQYFKRNNSKNKLETINEEVNMVLNGQKLYFDYHIVPIQHNEKEICYLVIARDITRRKEMEKKIQKSLEEKETFLKEIHHRVKNNLMVISSLLSLQSKYIKDKKALSVFKESQNRARSMAIIHEKLYQSNDLKSIDFGEYIEILAKELFRTYNTNSSQIKLKMDVENVNVDINIAIPLGLIVNELLSNSIKHAFPGEKMGLIKIDFHKNDDEFNLNISDNGIGFPEGFNFQNTDSLGFRIVNSLVNQIDATMEMEKTSGSQINIKFKEIFMFDN